MAMPHYVRLTALLMVTWVCTTAHAERYAVLVGVSQLLHQPRSLWLDGPHNDVAAVKATLAAQGISAARTTVLADGVEGATLPTQAAILQALDALTPRLTEGDSVLLYWSGHGVRHRATPKTSQEPDGLDEYLLARDAQVHQRTGDLRGAVRDAALGARIDAWQARGAQVFAVFDTCHAASSTRDAAPAGLRWRGLSISQLRGGTPVPGLADDLPAPRPRPNTVAFYASESHQRTPEWKGAGLFTQALLAAWTPTTPSYRTLATSTLQHYQRLAATLPIARSVWPSPLFEGDLDAPLWGRSSGTTLQKPAAMRPGAPLAAGVRARVTLQVPGQAPREFAMADADLGALPAGTQLTVAIDNSSGRSLDMALTHHVDAGPARVLYPVLAGDSNRLDAGQPGAPAHWQQRFTLTGDGAGPESLRLSLAPASPQSLPRPPGLDDAAGPAPWRARISWRISSQNGL